MGLTDERKRAGYIPETNPEISVKTNKTDMVRKLYLRSRFTFNRLLTDGKTDSIIIT